MVSQPRRHSRSNPQRFMHSSEVVINGMKGNSMGVVFKLLGKGICQAGETAHAHSHGKVLPLHKGSADSVFIWSAGYCLFPATNALRRAVAFLSVFPFRRLAVQLHQL